MSVSRGDVVLAVFPFTDARGAKRRPGLVVQCNRNNGRLDDVILALITSNLQRSESEPTQLLVDTASPDGMHSGLLRPSVVKCEHLLTVHQSLIDRVIGHLSPTAMKQIDQCLKSALELS
jgi:mRNA interferase MazF